LSAKGGKEREELKGCEMKLKNKWKKNNVTSKVTPLLKKKNEQIKIYKLITTYLNNKVQTRKVGRKAE